MNPSPEPAVLEKLLNDFDHIYGGDLTVYLCTDWRDHLGKLLLDAWTDGYTTGFADSGNTPRDFD